MGMFTTIEDPETGLSVQIKVGGDRCNTYKVGEVINELNGCYRALGDGDRGILTEYWVVVKNSKAVAVRLMSEYEEEDLLEEFGLP